MCAPEIVGDFIQETRLVCYQLHLERNSAFKSAIRQDPRAKAVDGENWSFIKTLQRAPESALELFSIWNFSHDLLNERQTLLSQTVRDCFSNTTAQFRRRQFGVSRHQNFLNRHRLLCQQSQDNG